MKKVGDLPGPEGPLPGMFAYGLVRSACAVRRPSVCWPLRSAAPRARRAGADPVLGYDRPAAQFLEALPVGNGRLGAMLFGRIHDERIPLNENSLWDGYKRDTTNPEALKALPEVRRLLFDGQDTSRPPSWRASTMMGRPVPDQALPGAGRPVAGGARRPARFATTGAS